jgi:predicted ATPase
VPVLSAAPVRSAPEAERQPVLVAWEDLHWADPTTLEYLGLLVEQAPTVPMLHVLTYRPEFSQPWPPRSHITPLVLNRLERLQVEALITQRAGAKPSRLRWCSTSLTKRMGCRCMSKS